MERNRKELARPERFELEPICGRERSGSPQAKSRVERGISGAAKLRKLARPERFELPTYSSGGCRSIQLSYGRAVVR